MFARSIFLAALLFVTGLSVFGQSRAITVVSEPAATVWIDDVRYGETDAKGSLALKTVAPGAHKLRVRAFGFKEVSQPLTAAQRGEVRVALGKTTDPAEIAFQDAEKLLASDKEKAIASYQKAIRLNPKYAAAILGLARAQADNGDNEAAREAIAAARRARPAWAEASAVEGRIYKSEDDETRAMAAFKRALTEGKGFQPEAHTGLGMLYKEKAESIGAGGDFDEESKYYNLAAASLKTAIKQLSGAPDAEIIYQLLGAIYEKQQKKAEAIAVYEEFLRVFPNSSEAAGVRSFIVQLKKEM